MMTEDCCAILGPAAPLIGWSAAGVWTIHWHHHRPLPIKIWLYAIYGAMKEIQYNLKNKQTAWHDAFRKFTTKLEVLHLEETSGVWEQRHKSEAQFENKSYYIGASNGSWMSHLQLKNNSKGFGRWVSVTVTQQGQDKHGGEGYGRLYACNRCAPLCTDI